VDLARKLKFLGCVAALVVIFAPDLVEATPADPAIMAKVSPRKANPGHPKRKPNSGHHKPKASHRHNQKQLVERGRELFMNETFNGNGRTCATCHPATNNFTLDPAFIAKLPPGDPLFVAETNPDLAAPENSVALRQNALISENLDGSDRPAVLRGVPHTLGLPVSIAPDDDDDSDQVFPDGTKPVHALGWSADGSPGDGSLRQFAAGAVVQHLTKSMNRVEGVDFRMPTDDELDALEAFQRSLGRQEEIDLEALTFLDDAAERGKDLFDGVGINRACTQCHANAGANVADDEDPDEAFNDNFDTGTRLLGAGPPDGGFGQDAEDGVAGFGNGTINTPSLIEAADTAPFFHNNSAATLEDSIRFYTTATFAGSPSGSDDGAFVLDDAAIADIAAFLRALNARENARSALAGLVDARRRHGSEQLPAVAADIEDGIEVLEASDLAPDAVAAFADAAKLIAGSFKHGQALDRAQRILKRIPSLIAVKSEKVAHN
jgi:cytochrome c peroxidase